MDLIEIIVEEVCDSHNLTYKQLRTKGRKRHIVKARQIAMYFLKKYTKLSLISIGDVFCGFDHTSVIHSCQTVKDIASIDKDYSHDLTQLENKIKDKI